MGRKKITLLLCLLTLGFATAIIYTSCSKKDKCDDIQCLNGGQCNDGVCSCPLGYEGPNCKTESRQKFLGNFNALDQCPVPDTSRSSADLSYVISINPGDSLKTVYVRNLANISNAPDYELTATLTAQNELTINPQTLPDNRVYSGKITFQSSGHLSATFQIKQNGIPVEACSSTLSN